MKARTLFLFLTCIFLSAGVNAQKVKGPAPVNLSVTIDDSVNQSGSVGIGSDLGGAYVNGQQSVAAQFLSTGVFSFKSGTRSVKAYYGLPMDSQTTPLQGPESGTGVQMLTFVKSTFLQTMAIGELRCEGLLISFNLGSITRSIGYQAGRGAISNTGPTLVSHPDSNTWIVQSDSGSYCGSFDSIARVRDTNNSGKPGDVDQGRYFMPLRLVLTRQS
jgi:hypothetical protein